MSQHWLLHMGFLESVLLKLVYPTGEITLIHRVYPISAFLVLVISALTPASFYCELHWLV